MGSFGVVRQRGLRRDLDVSSPLDDNDRQRLLALARAALRDGLHADGSVDRALQQEPSAALAEPRGAFVSLKTRSAAGASSLRGCIGTTTARGPLYRTVIEVARKAAFEDPRFPPLTAEELDAVRIEISALSPITSVDGPPEIEVGRHGVQLRRGDSGAVFLPQVAGEHGWDRETLLEQLALKAGLAGEAWRDAELGVFEAEVFAESTD